MMLIKRWARNTFIEFPVWFVKTVVMAFTVGAGLYLLALAHLHFYAGGLCS